MIKKTCSLFVLFLILILSMTIVFAQDSNTTDILTSTNIDNELEEDISIEGNSFSDIQNSIDTASSEDTIYLNGNTYNGNGTQINISKSITIDGSSQNEVKKSTLNANNLSRIFYINGKYNITLKNLIFENANFDSNGAAIYSLNANVTLNNIIIHNLNLTRTTGVSGTMFNIKNSNLVIDNLTFNNNTIISNSYFYGSFFIENSTSKVSNVKIFNNNITSNNQIRACIFAIYKGNFSLENYSSHNNTYKSYYRFFFGADLYSESANVLNLTNLYICNNTLGTYRDDLNVELGGLSICIITATTINLKNYTFCYNNLYHSSVSKVFNGAAIYIAKNSIFNISYVNIFKNNAYYPNYAKNVDPYDKSTKRITAYIAVMGKGCINNCNFSDNYIEAGYGALQIVPSYQNDPIIVENCYFINNFIGSSKSDSNRTYFADHAGGICVSGSYNGSAIIRNCLFVNNTNSQGGAITPHNNCIIENCIFINNTATKFYGGAISTEDGLDKNNANITIRNCYFEGNAAPIGGAIQAKGDYVNIYDCDFVNNYAVQGGGVFLEGKNLKIINCNFTNNNATHDLDARGIVTGQDYLPQVNEWTALGGAVYIHGENAKLENNTFKYNSAIHGKNESVEGKGGAIYIFGNSSNAVNCYFDDNYAHSGNGSAIYVYGLNSTITKSEFYKHDSSRGTVYIIGSNTTILDSKFINNTASRGGAGLYCEGNYTLVNNTLFENNNATIHGGAIHTHGNYVRILNSYFTSNNALPNDEDIDYGLGGAIYTKGDFNDISHCTFEFNTARNGSAIYNRGENLTIEDGKFHYNRAWSYMLNLTVTPEISVYSKKNNVIVNITHIGGDNIINAIFNDGSQENIFFYNVTYEHSSTGDGVRNSGLTRINPVLGAENSNGGKLIYQDSREDLQIINLVVARDITSNLLGANTISGEMVYNTTMRTGLYGNLSNILSGLKPGNYTIYASHPEDKLYKAIDNNTRFEILPYVDLSISKSSDKDSYLVGDIATFTITVKSLGTDASNVIVNESLPEGLKIVSYSVSAGSFNISSNLWTIETLAQDTSEKLTLRVKILSNGTYTNVVNVTSSDDDVNLTNNIANKTITAKNYVDLKITKNVNIKKVRVGDKVVWIITVSNIGSTIANNVKVLDKLSKSLKYISYYASAGEYDSKTGIWNINAINPNETVTLAITTKVLSTGNIINTAKIIYGDDVNSTNNNDSANITAIKPLIDGNISENDSNKYEEIHHKYSVSNSENVTGNPLMILLMVLLFIPLRRFKI